MSHEREQFLLVLDRQINRAEMDKDWRGVAALMRLAAEMRGLFPRL